MATQIVGISFLCVIHYNKIHWETIALSFIEFRAIESSNETDILHNVDLFNCGVEISGS